MDDVDNPDGRGRPDQAYRRKRRRASLQSTFFALPTTNEYFKQQHFLPCKIIGILFLSTPNPDPNQIRLSTVDKLIKKFPRFASFVSLEEDPESKERIVMFNELDQNEIDIGYHFKVIDGKGTFTEEKDTSELVSEGHLLKWDVTKPLWQLTLVTNMKDGRSLLRFVVDHTIGDGTSMAAIMSSLFDDDEEKDAKTKKNEEPIPVATRTSQPTNGHHNSHHHVRISHRISSFLYAITIGLANLSSDPDNCFKFPTTKKRADPIGRNCSQTKHFSLKEMKAIKKRLPGVTINDLLMAVVTLAMRKYLEKEKNHLPEDINGNNKVNATFHRLKHKIHLSCPINYRPHGTTLQDLIEEGGSNRVVVVPFQVPLQEEYQSPIDTIWQCKSRMDIYKTTPVVSIAFHIANFLTKHLPWSLLEQVGSDAFFNSTGVISNVIGPTTKASIGGYTIDDFAFYGVVSGTFLPCRRFHDNDDLSSWCLKL